MLNSPPGEFASGHPTAAGDSAPDPRANHSTPLTGVAKSDARARIVVVDDDPSVRDVIREYLDRLGFAVEAHKSGGEAMRSIVRHRADLVISDLLMPETDGLALLMAIRRLAPQPRVIVITGGTAHTGYSLAAARQLGAAATLWKPFRLPELLNVVLEVLTGPNRRA